jgi:hypothetical protein
VVDELVAVTGFRPDLGPLRELRLDRPDHGGPTGARPADRPERPQLWHGAAAWRGGTGAARAGLLRRRHEELRPRADLPHADRLRAGPVDCLCADRRRRGGPEGRAHAPRVGGLQHAADWLTGCTHEHARRRDLVLRRASSGARGCVLRDGRGRAGRPMRLGPRGVEVIAAPAGAGYAGSAREAAPTGGRELLPLRLVPSSTLRDGGGASRCCN